MAYKYYKSDFAVMITISAKYINNNFEEVALTSATPFVFNFYINGKGDAVEDCYKCSYDGSVVENCKIIDDTHVLCFFDRSLYELPLGNLMVEVNFDVNSNNYEGDSVMNISRLYNTGITITDQPDLDTDDSSFDVAILPTVFEEFESSNVVTDITSI